MSTFEFLNRRRSSTYKLGDYVYFLEPDFSGSYARYKVRVGTVIELPDKYSVSYGIRPLDTPEDYFAMSTCDTRDMRKLRKDEVKALAS